MFGTDTLIEGTPIKVGWSSMPTLLVEIRSLVAPVYVTSPSLIYQFTQHGISSRLGVTADTNPGFILVIHLRIIP